jgi:hypothetical protein
VGRKEGWRIKTRRRKRGGDAGGFDEKCARYGKEGGERGLLKDEQVGSGR